MHDFEHANLNKGAVQRLMIKHIIHESGYRSVTLFPYSYLICQKHLELCIKSSILGGVVLGTNTDATYKCEPIIVF